MSARPSSLAASAACSSSEPRCDGSLAKLAARSNAAAAVMSPPRFRARRAVCSSSAATAGSRPTAAAARCHTRRSGVARERLGQRRVRGVPLGDARGLVDRRADQRVRILIIPNGQWCHGPHWSTPGRPGPQASALTSGSRPPGTPPAGIADVRGHGVIRCPAHAGSSGPGR